MFTNDLKNVFNLFFPKRCLLCNENISLHEILCLHCYSLCHPYQAPLFLSNNFSIGALFYYEFSIRELILKAKFNKEILSLEILRKIIVDNIKHNSKLNLYLDYNPSIITYVPTHWRSRLFRGYDLPEIFAHIMGEVLRVPIINLLKLRKFKIKQSAINKKSKRMVAIKEAFILRDKVQEFDKILLVDDITTTGATINEAMKTLKPITHNIRALAIAKTP